MGSPGVRVDYIPDEDGIGVWVNGLEIGAHGADVEQARRHLLREAQAYVANFLGQLSVYRMWPDRARLLPHVHRLPMARSDEELARLLFGPDGASQEKSTATVGSGASFPGAAEMPAT